MNALFAFRLFALAVAAAVGALAAAAAAAALVLLRFFVNADEFLFVAGRIQNRLALLDFRMLFAVANDPGNDPARRVGADVHGQDFNFVGRFNAAQEADRVQPVESVVLDFDAGLYPALHNFFVIVSFQQITAPQEIADLVLQKQPVFPVALTHPPPPLLIPSENGPPDLPAAAPLPPPPPPPSSPNDSFGTSVTVARR